MKNNKKIIYSLPFAIQNNGNLLTLNSFNAKSYSTMNKPDCIIKPLKVYSDSQLEKNSMLSENKDKVVVYR